jgi:hypothetical protein
MLGFDSRYPLSPVSAFHPEARLWVKIGDTIIGQYRHSLVKAAHLHRVVQPLLIDPVLGFHVRILPRLSFRDPFVEECHARQERLKMGGVHSCCSYNR